ncbi:guanine nucleotide binding protein, alpha activating activity polypeptide O [Fimicolochytrium jonesii]|uniref:guanine nucleotide binding protein, alpha activating activity polypeptide O n=1 Tax=Fimicolochytrium jonesii TaxID=1396493 RepID=UPI0022FE8990|nr:guanine nucleotide binding protein, alpha activating activity polypeptide O [Fimicolochytrium jonesii]KAI8817772.1 guanine nucleotide binding protein, alpha activating activity polypeptide O [Fimicolochytrium jonesii]
MGACVSTPDEKASAQRTQAINRLLTAEARCTESDVKLLLLGAGESGKSTVLKQFKLIHGVPFADDDRKVYKSTIHGNVVESLATLLEGMRRLELKYQSEKGKEAARRIREGGVGLLTPEFVQAVHVFWNDAGVQRCYARSNELQLIDCCQYYLSDLPRLASPTYTPTDQDILRARVTTTSITEHRLLINGLTFRLFDLGGQRSERKKWAPYFDDVHAIIFLAAISAYDQRCKEDNETNRMLESLNLFDSICNHPLFRDTSIILFLNKVDVFTQKLKTTPIVDYFPDYKGPNTFDTAATFFAQRFMNLNRSAEKKVYIHFTWATDTGHIATVLATVKALILKENLHASGLF